MRVWKAKEFIIGYRTPFGNKFVESSLEHAPRKRRQYSSIPYSTKRRRLTFATKVDHRSESTTSPERKYENPSESASSRESKKDENPSESAPSPERMFVEEDPNIIEEAEEEFEKLWANELDKTVNSALKILYSTEVFNDFIGFFSLVINGRYPLTNIAFLLWLETVRWFTIPYSTHNYVLLGLY